MYGMPDMSNAFSMFNAFSILFVVMFVVVLGIIVVTIAKRMKEWNNNNNSPRLSVNATVVSKRMDVRHYNNGEHMGTSNSSVYYVTFQVDSMDRMELRVSGSEYGMLVEGDYGILSFQGTRYLGFDRAY